MKLKILGTVAFCVLALPVLAQGPDMSDPTLAAAKAAQDSGNYVEAVALYEQAAVAGQAIAAVQLASIYLTGEEGVPQDFDLAMIYAQAAADAGESRGLLTLGKIWMEGDGVVADQAKALDYFTKADAAGDMKAARYIGLIAAAEGNDETAVQWWTKGAEAGDITSQFYLGRAFETGAGVAQDYAAAMLWYTTAATRGDLIASDGMVGQAGLYERGEGVAQDMDAALALYRQAAELGNAAAVEALARLGD